MRKDMQKVIVERGRHGGRGQMNKPRRRGDEWEGYPKQQGMRRVWKDRKELSDNLNPLWRYLDKQVGRPWDKVWSEMCQHLDFRTVLGFHTKSHLDQHVTLHVDIINGLPFERRAYYGLPPWEINGLYVHPVDGLLKRHIPRKKGRV